MRSQLRSLQPLLVAIAVISAAPAAAQDAPRLQIGAAAGVAFPVHGDFDFEPAEWQVGLRGAVSPLVVVEGFLGRWRETIESEIPGGNLFGPSGNIGTFSGGITRRSHTVTTVGLNALIRGATGRVTITAGGGPGFWVYRRTFDQDLFDCSAPAPPICDSTGTSSSQGRFSVQGVAHVDVALTTRRPGLAAFGQVQFTTPVSAADAAHTSLLGGIRVGLR